MVKFKWLCGLLFFLFGFLLSAELSQNYFECFTEETYYIDVSNDDRQLLYETMKEAAAYCHTQIFAVQTQHPTHRLVNVHIFIDRNQQTAFETRYAFDSDTYTSLFSGTTDIQFHDFSEIITQTDIERFYFPDISEHQAEMLYQYLQKRIGCSYVHKETASGLHMIAEILWILPLLFLLLLTWFSIQTTRKKDFLRISLGASVTRLMLRAIVMDLLIFSAEFAAVFFLLRPWLYVQQHFGMTLLLFLLFLLLNSLLHCTLLRFSYKEILYGANLNQRLLSDCYLMKSAILILTIFTVSINAHLILKQTHYLQYQEQIAEYSNHVLLNPKADAAYYKNLLAQDSETEWDDTPLAFGYYTASQSIMRDALYDERVSFSYQFASYENNSREETPLCLTNDTKFIVSDKLRGMIDENADLCCFYPNDCTAEQLEDIVRNLICGSLNLNPDVVHYSFIPYDFRADVLYLDADADNGFEVLESPCCVYCHFQPDLKLAMTGNGFVDEVLFQNAVFSFNDIDINQLKETYHLAEIQTVSASEQFESRKNAMVRMVLLNSVISVLMILWNFSISATIIRLQYAIHAKRISLMKVLGYSMYQRNLSIFMLNAFSVCIGLITNCILASMYHMTECLLVFAVTGALWFADTLLSYWNMERMEQTETAKILKGGSL